MTHRIDANRRLVPSVLLDVLNSDFDRVPGHLPLALHHPPPSDPPPAVLGCSYACLVSLNTGDGVRRDL